MIARIKSEITLWRVIVAIIFVTGIYATYIRFFEGFRASTNLSDQMPWGLWVGLGNALRHRTFGSGLRHQRSGLSARHGALSAHPARGDPDFVSRLPDGLRRISLRDRIALALLASHRDVEPPLGAVRRVRLHHDLHHRADL